MTFLSRLKIGQRLALGFGFLVAMFIGVQVFGGLQASKLNENTLAFSDNIVPSLTVLYDVKDESALTANDEAARVKDLKDAEASLAKLKTALNKYDDLAVDAEDRRHLGIVKAKAAAYADLSAKVAQLAAQAAVDPDKYQASRDLIVGEGHVAYNDLAKSLGEWWTYNEQLSANLSEASKATNAQVRVMIIAAKEIKTLINESVEKVENGAALVEESAAASESLNHQAKSLAEVVAVFKV